MLVFRGHLVADNIKSLCNPVFNPVDLSVLWGCCVLPPNTLRLWGFRQDTEILTETILRGSLVY